MVVPDTKEEESGLFGQSWTRNGAASESAVTQNRSEVVTGSSRREGG